MLAKTVQVDKLQASESVLKKELLAMEAKVPFTAQAYASVQKHCFQQKKEVLAKSVLQPCVSAKERKAT
jgi:hypothetical protein